MLERIITFDPDHIAKAIIIASTTDPPADVLEVMRLEKMPKGILSITGGTGKFPAELEQQTRIIIESAIVPLAYEYNLMVIDGGTNAGVIQIIGDAVEKARSIYPQVIGSEAPSEFTSRPPLVGFAPRPKVLAPSIEQIEENSVSLDQNHTYFILISDVEDWGGEVEYMFSFIEYLVLEQNIPALQIIFNGGRITIKEVHYAVLQHRPVLLLEGSMRAVEVIAAVLDGASRETITQLLLDKRRNIIEIQQLEETFEWLSAIREHNRLIERFNIKTQTLNELRSLILSKLHLADSHTLSSDDKSRRK